VQVTGSGAGVTTGSAAGAGTGHVTTGGPAGTSGVVVPSVVAGVVAAGTPYPVAQS
jgi:hypothetical protein